MGLEIRVEGTLAAFKDYSDHVIDHDKSSGAVDPKLDPVFSAFVDERDVFLRNEGSVVVLSAGRSA